jgi:hypothetical protein
MTFRHWLTRFCSQGRTERHNRPRRRTRPALETLESRIVPSFKFVTGDTDGTIYAVDTSGDLLWYKDTHRNGSGIVNGFTTSFDAPNEGAVIGTGWNQFTHVIDGGGGILYAIEPNGDLLWYKDTARNGTWGWDPNSGNRIGVGWNVFSQVFSGGNGVLYAIEPNGDLLWYKDLARNGTPGWDFNSGNRIGIGWNEFADVISNGNGIIYGRNYNGNLQWYQDVAQNGTWLWAAGSGNVVGTGWDTQRFSHILSGGQYNGGGIIYGIDNSWSVTGVRSTYLEFYKDLAQNGTINWDPSSGTAVGYGWVYPTVEGYGSAMSVAPGGSLSFYVSTGGSNLTVTYLRLHVDPQNALSGPYGTPMGASLQVAGQERAVTTSTPWAGAGWDQDLNHPADFSLTVPASWSSGLYAAQVVDDRGYVLYITFVVKPDPAHHNRIAVLANINTWDCYNDWGGRSRYNDGSGTFPVSLSFLRPDPAATPVSNYHSNDHQTPGEVWFLSWLDNAGYSYDVYSDVDFDRGIPGLDQYQTLILDTHPEYWTATMYQNLQGYLNQGGDLLYLGGNGIFDMVESAPDGNSVTVTTSPDNRGPSLFMNNGMDEGQLLGVDYYWAWDGHTGAPYQVNAAGAGHFFFQGTGLQAGDLIGQAGIYAPASGWEEDQAVTTIPGLEVLASGTNTDTTPADMTYYTTPADGFVFSTGSITFTNSLAVDPDLQAIIRNALDGVLTYQMPAGVAENLTLRRNGDTLELVDDQTAAVVASGPVGGVRSVDIIGADGENEGLTVDFAFGGSFPLQRGLAFDGGSGSSDMLTVVGGGLVNGAWYQPDSITSGTGALTLDNMAVTFSNVGSLSVSGVASLTLDDSGHTSAATYTFTGPTVQISGRSPIVTYSGLSHFTLYGGSAANTYNVESTPAGTTTTINAGAAYDTFKVSPTAKNLNNLAGPLTLNGGGGTANTITVNDQNSAAAQTYTLTATTLDRSGAAALTYGSVKTMTVSGGSGGNAFVVSAAPTATAVTLQGGSGTNTLSGPDATETWTVSAAGGGTLGAKVPFTAMHDLFGGSGNDTFKFTPTGSIAGTVNGGGGTANKLDYSTLAGPLTVNLQTLAAPLIKGGAAGGFSNIRSLAGSKSTADTLIGPNADTSWTISAVNGGKAGTVSFTGFEKLVGGSGVDVFKFSGTGSVAGGIDGGTAPLHKGNWLDYSGLAAAVTVNLATNSATAVAGGAAGKISNIQNVHGGNGGNTLTGNAQGNILIGGTGADTITGGTGLSLLIGDKGSDHVTGGSGGDLLVGDYTTYDTMTTANENALMSILAEWQSADSYATRFHDINTGSGGGLNGTAKLNFGSTVKDDLAADTVTAAASAQALDWFFQGAGDLLGNKETGEHINNT